MQKQKRTEKCRYLSLTAALMLTFFIWNNSMIPGVQSMETSQSLVDVVKPMMFSFQFDNYTWQVIIRKLAHFTEYSAVAVLWSWAMWYHLGCSWKLPVTAAGICFFTACFDEGLQTISHRTAMIEDVILDTVGGTLAALFCFMVLWLRHRKKARSAAGKAPLPQT